MTCCLSPLQRRVFTTSVIQSPNNIISSPIPISPSFFIAGHALLCDNKKRLNHFKVVLFHVDQYPDHDLGCISIFSSKSGKWETISVSYPPPKQLYCGCVIDVVTCSGIFYWLEWIHSVDRVISKDMKESPCVVIDFPQDFWWYEALPGGSVRQRIGAVDGELRLLQVVLMPYIEKAEVVLNFKVWKLNSSWVLVHDKRYRDERFLRWPNNQTLYAPFPHSTNGNVVFMVWGKTVLKCNLMMNDAYEVVHEIQEPETRTVCFPFVHPIWPTQLPS